MSELHFLQRVAKKLDTERDSILLDMATGVLDTHAEYKYACGTLFGIGIAKDVLVTIKDEINHEEEDDDGFTPVE